MKMDGVLIAANPPSLYDDKWAQRDEYELVDVFSYSYKKNRRPKRIEKAFGKGKAIFYSEPVELMLENEPNDELAQRILAETLALGIINMMFLEHPATADINILHTAQRIF